GNRNGRGDAAPLQSDADRREGPLARREGTHLQRPDGELLPPRASGLVAPRGRLRRRPVGLGGHPGIPADGAVPGDGPHMKGEPKAGQIVVVNGTSGAGKTTTCATFARRAKEPYLMFGMDLLAGTLLPARYTMFGSMKEEGYQPTAYGPVCMKALAAMHAMIAAASRTGQN